MRIIAIIIALAAGASGCAIAAAKGPEPVSLRARPDCNSSKGAVVADGLAAATLGLTAIGLGSNDETTSAVIVGLVAAAYTGSAVAGSRSADRCRDAYGQYDLLVQAQLETVGRQRADDIDRQRTADEAAARADATIDDVPPVVALPRPVVVKPPAPPTLTMRPTAPAPAAAGDDDDAGGDDEADDGADAGDWSEFWREVKP